MGFDKSKAMRNAERYVAHGKIRAAINEYYTVVKNDPRDFATLNMLGDLHAKNSEKSQAVACYLQVADHYNKQGFAQKAIAIVKHGALTGSHGIARFKQRDPDSAVALFFDEGGFGR